MSGNESDRELNPADDEIAWTPPSAYIERSRLRRFIEHLGLESYDDFLTWATADAGRYWDAVVHDLDLEWHHPYSEALNLDQGAPWAEWFVGGGFNYVHNALDRHATGARRNQLALVWEGDDGTVRKLSYWELANETNRLANALKRLGVKKGDRVGIFLPMVPETVAATLACSKIGAIYTPMFSGYGEEAVASRLRDCEATVLITADAFLRRGKLVTMKQVADAAIAAAPTVTTCLVLKRSGCD